MRRYLITQGARTTAGGTVLDGATNNTINGVPIAYVGARIYCPACGTTGHGINVPPFHTQTLFGVQVLLDGDKCVCACVPSPTLLKSQDVASHLFEDDIQDDAHAMGDALLSASQAAHVLPPASGATCWVLLRDSSTGQPLGNHPVIVEANGRRKHTITDADGYARVASDTPSDVMLHAIFVAPRRSLTPNHGI
jgi:uncharacterized Zn-binding protein involved in type VI secretion